MIEPIGHSPSPRVIVVEDEPTMRELVSALAAALGCEVVAEAKDDVTAVAAFKKFRPDITFLDIDLGMSNGLDVLKRIKGIASDAAVVMLTGMDDPSVAEHCLIHGAQGYISKTDGSDMRNDIAEQIAIWCG